MAAFDDIRRIIIESMGQIIGSYKPEIRIELDAETMQYIFKVRVEYEGRIFKVERSIGMATLDKSHDKEGMITLMAEEMAQSLAGNIGRENC